MTCFVYYLSLPLEDKLLLSRGEFRHGSCLKGKGEQLMTRIFKISPCPPSIIFTTYESNITKPDLVLRYSKKKHHLPISTPCSHEEFGLRQCKMWSKYGFQ